MSKLSAYLPFLISASSQVKDAIATGLSLKNVTSLFPADAISIFEGIGEQMFPRVAPELRAAAAIVASYDPNYVKWVQNTLNHVVTPSPSLVVDGGYGPKTQAAVAALQVQLGLAADGWVGDITLAAIRALLTKFDTAAIPAPKPVVATVTAPG